MTVDRYNKITKDVFLKYLDSEEIFLNSKELLRTELQNYLNHIVNKKEAEKLFENILKTFNVAKTKNQQETINALTNFLSVMTQIDEQYMTYYINQPKDFRHYTPKDFATYYFKSIDDLIEGCFKPRLELFYIVYNFNKSDNLLDITNKTLGSIVNQIEGFDYMLKDPIFNISINQWRNISAHKDFKISKDNIIIKYGKKENRKTQFLTHNQLREISYWCNSVYCILRLAQIIIYMNSIEDIIKTENYKNIQLHIRSEQSLLNIIHNLQIVGFEFHSFSEGESIFELNLYIKANNDIKESILHASQAFTQIAIALDEDEFQKDNFEFIQINILKKTENAVASANIDIETCLEHSYGKIELKDFIKRINFKGI